MTDLDNKQYDGDALESENGRCTGTQTHERRNFRSISRIVSLRDPSLSFRDIAPFRFV